MLSRTSGATARPTGAGPQPAAYRTYRCPACGYALRVAGSGRHCVYFELTDEALDNPVMNRVCPACGHGLLGKNPSGLPAGLV